MKASTELLLSVAFVLTPPEHWIQHMFHSEIEGEPPGWCIYGAVEFAITYLNVPTRSYQAACKALTKVMGGASMVQWNDVEGRTHQEVLDVLYKAAAITERE
jgi:hypothetical protein